MTTRPHAAVFTMDPTKLEPGWTDEEITAVFAHTEVDLTRAPPADDARLRVTAIFGDVRVLVPPGTRVEMDGVSVFGHRNNPLETEGAKLHLSTTAVFGAVDVVEKGEASAPAPP